MSNLVWGIIYTAAAVGGFGTACVFIAIVICISTMCGCLPPITAVLSAIGTAVSACAGALKKGSKGGCGDINCSCSGCSSLGSSIKEAVSSCGSAFTNCLSTIKESIGDRVESARAGIKEKKESQDRSATNADIEEGDEQKASKKSSSSSSSADETKESYAMMGEAMPPGNPEDIIKDPLENLPKSSVPAPDNRQPLNKELNLSFRA